MEESLRTLRELDPDVVIPSAYVGEVVEAEMAGRRVGVDH